MKRNDWLLLVLSAAKDQGLTPVQIQKALFLLAKNVPNSVGTDFYKFAAYHYGPFDKRVYLDAEELASAGMVLIAKEPGKEWSRYYITAPGAERAQKLLKEIPKIARVYIDDVVAWCMRLSFQQLVRSIYQAFPQYRRNSVFQD